MSEEKPKFLFVNTRRKIRLNTVSYTGISLLIGYLSKNIPEYYYEHFNPDLIYYDLYKDSRENLMNLSKYKKFWFKAMYDRLAKNDFIKYLAFSNIESAEQYQVVSEFVRSSKIKYPGIKFIISCLELFQNEAKQIFDCVVDLSPGELVLANYIKPGQYEYSLERMEFRNADFYKKYNYPLLIMSRRRICVNHCLFCFSCTNDLLCKQLNIRNKQKLDRFKYFADDIEYYVKETGIKKFYILDNVLNMSLVETKVFLKKLLFKNLQIKYSAHIILENVDTELLQLLEQSGCVRVNLGIDSGSPKFSRFLHGKNKRLTLFTMVRRLLLLKKYKFVTSVNLIYAYPYETTRDFLKTLKLARIIYKNKINELIIFRFCFDLRSEFGINARRYHLKHYGLNTANIWSYTWSELGKDKNTVEKRGDIYSRLMNEHFKELQKMGAVSKTKAEELLVEFLKKDITKSMIIPIDRAKESVDLYFVDDQPENVFYRKALRDKPIVRY
jgi:hypothetical protein